MKHCPTIVIIALTALLTISCTSTSNDSAAQADPLPNMNGKETSFVKAMGFYMSPMEHSANIWPMAYSPDGTQLASGSSDGLLRVWSARFGQQEMQFQGHEGRVMGLGWSPDGTRIASSGEDGLVIIWHLQSQTKLKELKGHKDWAASAAWSPDAAKIASGGRDGSVRIWNAESGQLLHTLKGHDEYVWPVAWNPESTVLASGGNDGAIKIWNAETGSLERTLVHKAAAWVNSLAWSPDGNSLASGGDDNNAVIWNPETGEKRQTLSGHNKYVQSVAYSPDGNRLATGSADGTLRIWDADTGAKIREMQASSDWINAVDWKPSGRQLASAGKDDAIHIWDTVTGRLVNTGEYQLPDGTTLRSGRFAKDLKETPYAQLWDIYVKQDILLVPEGFIGAEAALLAAGDGWPDALNTQVQDYFAQWLKLADQTMPGIVPQPALPEPILLTQEEWEINSEFEDRVNEAQSARQAEVDRIQEQYRQDVEARNAQVLALQQLQGRRRAVLPQMRAAYIQTVMDEFLTQATAADAKLDQTSNELFITMQAPGNTVQALGTYVLQGASAALRKQALSNPSSLAVEIEPFAREDGNYGLDSASLHYEGQEYAMTLTAESVQNSGSRTITIGADDSIADLAQTALQDAVLVDRNAMGSITYKDGTQAFIDFDDDLGSIIRQIAKVPQDNSKWALVIGAETYRNTDNILYARRSAEVFAQAIQASQGIPKGHVYTIYDEEATSGNLKTQIQTLLEKGISQGDTVYFYYNGHGIPAANQGNAPYLLPTDMSPDFVTNEPFFQMQNILEQFQNSKAGKVLVFMDSCFTGKVDGLSVFKNVAAASLAPRKVNLSEQGKVAVIAAGTNTQYSNAYSEKGHRLFTYYLVRAIASPDAPIRSTNQLHIAVKKEVSAVSRLMGPLKYQDPTIQGNGDLSL